MGYLRKLGEKKYRIIYDLAPAGTKRRQRTETLVGVTKAQAEAILAQRKQDVARGELRLESEVRMNDVFDRFMEAKCSRLAPSTVQRYESLLNVYLRPAFGTMPAKDVQPADLVAMYGRWSKKVGSRTVRHAADLMRNVLNRAVKWNIVLRNPALLLDADDLPRKAKPQTAVLTDTELVRLLGEAEHPANTRRLDYVSACAAFYPSVAFAAFTGARRGEILALRWSDLRLDAGEATIARSLTDAKKLLRFKTPKNGLTRVVCLPERLVALLRTHRANQAAEKLALGAAYRDQDLVFALPDGNPIPPWNFTAAFRALVRRAQVTRVRLHDLRHTHASLLAKAGVPLEVISKRLGHSTIAITADLYMSVYRERDAEAAARFAALVTERLAG